MGITTVSFILQKKKTNCMQNAVVITVDRLGSGMLGPYGNTWIETPALCRLASEGLLLENCIGDSIDLETLFRSWWTGRHAMCPRGIEENDNLLKWLQEADVKTVLITDSQELASHPLAEAFDHVKTVSVLEPDTLAEEIDQTQMARPFAEGLAWLETESDEPFFLWIHSSGMSGPWDAPFDFRERFVDEDDPDPSDTVTPPCEGWQEERDPDKVQGLVHAYAGQVMLADMCLDIFLQALADHPAAANCLTVFASPRGFPLGEHGRLGAGEEALFGESLNLPLILRWPDGRGALCRSHSLVQPADLCATLAGWFGHEGPLPDGARDLAGIFTDQQWQDRLLACAIAKNERAIRTPVWFMRLTDEGNCNLFVKPDDAWEANEASDRCQFAIEPLTAAIDQFARAVIEGTFATPFDLPDEVVIGLE